MRRHLLRELEFATVLQVFRDPGGPERVIPDLRVDSGGERPPPNHPISVCLHHGFVGQPTRAASSGPE